MITIDGHRNALRRFLRLLWFDVELIPYRSVCSSLIRYAFSYAFNEFGIVKRYFYVFFTQSLKMIDLRSCVHIADASTLLFVLTYRRQASLNCARRWGIRPNAPRLRGGGASRVMKKVAYKYGPYTKQRSRPGQLKSPNENHAWISCDTCLVGHLWRRIWWWHYFFTRGKIKVRSNWAKFWNSRFS